MASQTDVAQVVAMIGSAYPNFSATKETVGVYYELLKDLPLDLLRASALQCCAESGRKFAPSVGEIRGAAGDLERKAQGVPSALEAWGEMCEAPKPRDPHFPLYRDGQIVPEEEYKWSHPLVGRVAKLLGWPDFPSLDNETIDRAHFLKQYDLETQNRIADAIELPAVTEYITARRTDKALPIGEELKRITARLENKQ